MSRNIIAALAVLGVCSIGFAVFAADHLATTATPQSEMNASTITFKAVKTGQGSVIEVTAGDVVILVPRLTLKRDDNLKPTEVTTEDGRLRIHADNSGPSLECVSITMQLRNPKAVPVGIPVPSPDDISLPPVEFK